MEKAAGSEIKKAVLQRARSGGGKWVVRVLVSPPPEAAQFEDLAREVRKALGTGDRVEDWLKKRGVQKIVR